MTSRHVWVEATASIAPGMFAVLQALSAPWWAASRPCVTANMQLVPPLTGARGRRPVGQVWLRPVGPGRQRGRDRGCGAALRGRHCRVRCHGRRCRRQRGCGVRRGGGRQAQAAGGAGAGGAAAAALGAVRSVPATAAGRGPAGAGRRGGARAGGGGRRAAAAGGPAARARGRGRGGGAVRCVVPGGDAAAAEEGAQPHGGDGRPGILGSSSTFRLWRRQHLQFVCVGVPTVHVPIA
jgi:hypothetical protein